MGVVDFAQTIFNILIHGRYNSTPPTVANGATSELQCDNRGRILVNVAASVDPGATGERTFYSTDAVGASGELIASSAKGLVEIVAQNMSGNVRYLQLFNLATSPTALDEPAVVYRLEANGFINRGYQSLPRAFSAGIAWAVSSTHDTYTSSGDKFFVEAVVQDPA